MKTIQSILSSLSRLPGALLHPKKYFSQENDFLLDGALTSLLLFIATTLQKLVWRETPGETIALSQAAIFAVLNTLMAWTGFFAIYYLVMVITKVKTNLPGLLGAAGVAGLPVVVVTLLSALSWWIGSLFDLTSMLPAWIAAQNTLAWIGLAFGWPGWMAYCIFRYNLKLTGHWPVFFSIILIVFLFAAWLVNAL